MDVGGRDRTRTCTPLPTNGFLDRGSTNYAYSSKYAELTGVRKPLALNADTRDKPGLLPRCLGLLLGHMTSRSM